MRTQQLVLQSMRDMEAAQADVEQYMLAWRTITKLQAVESKLDANDYTLLPPTDLFTMEGETADQAVLAFTIARGVARIDFRRGTDDAVFAVIDTCAANQQAAWDLAVKEFNEKPVEERERLVEAHRRSEAELARLNAEMNATAQANPLEVARARHGEIRRLQKDLLPFFMVVPKGQTIAWARRSIGR